MEGTYPPIFEGCEHNGVIKSPNIGLFLEDMGDLTFGPPKVDFLEFVDFEVGKEVCCRSLNGCSGLVSHLMIGLCMHELWTDEVLIFQTSSACYRHLRCPILECHVILESPQLDLRHRAI